jgi:hypothetical protein
MSIRKAYFNLTLRQFIKLNQIPKEDWLERLLFVYPKSKTLDIIKCSILYEDLKEAENELPKTKLSKFYRVGWNWYYLNTKLSAVRADQFIDLAHFAGQEEPTEEIHNILAVFLIPVKSFFGEWLYKGSIHKEVANDLLNMKLKDATPIMVFFCNYLEKLSEAIPTYLVEKAEKLSLFIKNGDGLPQ